MPKSYIVKPERVQALYYDGTTESAKEIISWVKDVIGELDYSGSTVRQRRERTSFGQYDGSSQIELFNDLYIYTKTWGSIELHPNSWLTLDEREGWSTAGELWFKTKYIEEK